MDFKKHACFIDALNLGEECEAETLIHTDEKLVDETSVEALSNNIVKKERHSNEDSLEQSNVSSPISHNQNLSSQHNPMSWFVDIKSVEGSPPVDGVDKATKKNMFNMFVELAQPEEMRKKIFDPKPPIDRKSLNCVKKKLLDVWSSNSDLKESGFVSDQQEEKVKPQIMYPSLNFSCGTSYVKLSDLDKTPKMEFGNEKVKPPLLLTKSIPDNNSVRQSGSARISRSTGFLPIYTENTKSLNRIFPSLSNEFCRSVPGLVFNSRSETPSEMDELTSEISESSTQTIASSTDVMHDSFGFVQNTNQNRLGEDLLRMFEKEIVTDVTIEFAGRRVGAHKCILASRCPHFASLMSGGWVESAGNSIRLDGFSYMTVNFTLRYIYSGASVLPENINLNEITSLADKLGLEGLKEVITLTIKDKYCHNFHKPCGLCTLGVLECLPICLTYGLEEVYQRSLYWLTEYFVEIWPTKAFGSMSTELIEKVCQQHKVNMTHDNVVKTVCGLREIGLSLPSVRWAESVERACRTLLKVSENFISIHLAAVLKSLLNDRSSSVCITQEIVAELILASIRAAPMLQVCKSYEYLSNVCVGRHTIGRSMRELRVVEHWRRECEDVLVHAPAYIAQEPGFQALPNDLQARLGKRGYPRLIDSNGGSPVRNSTPKQTPGSTPASRAAAKLFARIYTSFTPYSSKPAAPANTNNMIMKEGRKDTSLQKLPTNRPVIRTTIAQKKREQFNRHSEESKSKATRPYKPYAPPANQEPPKNKMMDSSTLNRTYLQTSGRDVNSSESSRKSSPLFSKNLVKSSRIQSRPSVDMHLSSSKRIPLNSSKSLAGDNTNCCSSKSNLNQKVALNNGNSDITKITCAPEKSSAVLNKNRNVSRIPVFIGKTKVTSSSPSLLEPALSKLPNGAAAPGRGRKPTSRMGSLMCPTKSSAAKMVQKKTPSTSKTSVSQCSGDSSGSMLQRSTTFIKEEPCFPGSPDISNK